MSVIDSNVSSARLSRNKNARPKCASCMNHVCHLGQTSPYYTSPLCRIPALWKEGESCEGFDAYKVLFYGILRNKHAFRLAVARSPRNRSKWCPARPTEIHSCFFAGRFTIVLSGRVKIRIRIRNRIAAAVHSTLNSSSDSRSKTTKRKGRKESKRERDRERERALSFSLSLYIYICGFANEISKFIVIVVQIPCEWKFATSLLTIAIAMAWCTLICMYIYIYICCRVNNLATFWPF